MAVRVQILPSVVVPRSPHQSTFERKKTHVQENFPAAVNLHQFEKKYHALTALYSHSGESTTSYRQLTFRPKSWSYGNRDLVKFLITGYLPKSAFYEKWKASERRKTRTKKISPTGKEEGLQENITELWSPKDKIKLRETGRQVEKLIMDARFRRKENLENVAERVQKSRNCQADVIRMNKGLGIRTGKSACLDKMEGQQKHPDRLINREEKQETHPDRFTNSADGQQINPDRLINIEFEGQQTHIGRFINLINNEKGQQTYPGSFISREERQKTHSARFINREKGQQTHLGRVINSADGQQTHIGHFINLINSEKGQQTHPCFINREEGQQAHPGRVINSADEQPTYTGRLIKSEHNNILIVNRRPIPTCSFETLH